MRRPLIYTTLTLLIALAVYVNTAYEVIPMNSRVEGVQKRDLRVMTWNIHDSGSDYKAHQKEIARLILSVDADVVLLEEFYMKTSSQLDSIVRACYPYTYDQWANFMAGEILYSRFPIDTSLQVRSDTLAALTNEYILSVNNHLVRLVGCHLISSNNFSTERYTFKDFSDFKTLPKYFKVYRKGQQRRTKECNQICHHLSGKPMPTLVMGDMNDFSGTPPLKLLTDAGLRDAWWEGGHGIGATFHEGWMRFRLDHIFHNDSLSLTAIQTVPTELSDHYPLVGDFLLKNL